MLVTDPLDLKLDEFGDFELGLDGDLQFVTGADAVAQLIMIAVLTVKGEWFLDLDVGIPYFERDGVAAEDAIMGQAFDSQKVVKAFAAEISSVPGVAGILSLSATFDGPTRTMTVTWAVSTVFGDTVEDSLTKGA
jgi:hypothetical protein